MGELSGATIAGDSDVEEGVKNEVDKLKEKIRQVESDIDYFDHLPPVNDVVEEMSEEEKEGFAHDNDNLPLENGWIFTQEDIERGIRYDVIGDYDLENEGPNYQDRLAYANTRVPRIPLIDGRRLGFTVGREQIMSETRDAAQERLEGLKRKLSEFEVEDLPKAA